MPSMKPPSDPPPAQVPSVAAQHRLAALIAEADAALEQVRTHQHRFGLKRPGWQYERIEAASELLALARSNPPAILQATMFAYEARRRLEQILNGFERAELEQAQFEQAHVEQIDAA